LQIIIKRNDAEAGGNKPQNGSAHTSGRSPHWVKVKNPKAPAVNARRKRIGAISETGLSMEERDLIKELDGLVKPTDPPKEAALENTAETPSSISPESILPRLPPEGQAWINGLNHYCRRAVEHDLRAYGPDLFVKYWTSLRDTLQKLERDFGPSDNWK